MTPDNPAAPEAHRQGAGAIYQWRLKDGHGLWRDDTKERAYARSTTRYEIRVVYASPAPPATAAPMTPATSVNSRGAGDNPEEGVPTLGRWRAAAQQPRGAVEEALDWADRLDTGLRRRPLNEQSDAMITLAAEVRRLQAEVRRLQQECARIASENACKQVELHKLLASHPTPVGGQQEAVAYRSKRSAKQAEWFYSGTDPSEIMPDKGGIVEPLYTHPQAFDPETVSAAEIRAVQNILVMENGTAVSIVLAVKRAALSAAPASDAG